LQTAWHQTAFIRRTGAARQAGAGGPCRPVCGMLESSGDRPDDAMWEYFVAFLCPLVVVGICFAFFAVLADPAEAAWKLGRCIWAFRRGLRGEPLDERAQCETPPERRAP
jgi:hypothetical protein